MTCETEPKHQLIEHKLDAYYAHTIRLVAKKHYRAALHIAKHPETYLAVQDAIDARVVGELGEALEDNEPSTVTSR